MQYLKESLRYIFVQGKGKHLLLLLLFGIVPSALFGYALPAEKILLNVISPPEYSWWGELWLSHTIGYRGLVNSGIAILLLFVTTACMCSIIVKHFRIGTFGMPSVLTASNDYFLPCLIYTLSNVIAYLFAYTLYTVFAYMWYIYFSPVAYAILCCISLVAIGFALFYYVSSIVLWLPTMTIKGLRGKTAFTTAIYQTRGKQKKLLPGKFFIVLLLTACTLISYFFSKIWYISWIINTVFYAFAYVYSIVHIIIVYFGENYLPREDLARSPYKRRY